MTFFKLYGDILLCPSDSNEGGPFFIFVYYLSYSPTLDVTDSLVCTYSFEYADTTSLTQSID
jgi:hypothetical protein